MAASEMTREEKAKLDEAFSQLYRAHLRDVYSYSYYRVGNHHDAEDLTEQTFLQAYRHFERAQRESDGRPLRPWLIRIAHNLAANYYRDRARRPVSAIEDEGAISAPHDTEALVEGRDELQRVLEGVNDLPDDRREALAPVDPPDELAERLESTLVTLTELAADELEAWELRSMRDPRNWARPAAAVAVGTAAGGALVVLRLRSQAKRNAQRRGMRALAERTARDALGQARRVLRQ